MKKFVFQLLLSLAIGGFFIWLALDRLISDIGETVGGGSVWRAMLDAFSQLRWWHIVGYIALFIGVHIIRILRWRLQLVPLGVEDFWKVVRVGAVGLAAIIVMPLRIGEFVRPWLLSRETDVSFSAALGTSVVERVVDGLCVSLMLFVCLTRPDVVVSGFVTKAAWVCFFVFLSVLIAVALFTWQRPFAERLVHATLGRISEPTAYTITELFEGFVDGIASLRQGGALLPYLGLTIAYWTLNAFSVWFWATAFGFDLPLIAGFGLVAILVVGIMVPAGPGFFGNFQLFLGEGLLVYLPAASIGAVGFAMAVGLNLIQFVVQLLIALPFYFATSINLRDAIRVAENEGEPSE